MQIVKEAKSEKREVDLATAAAQDAHQDLAKSVLNIKGSGLV